MQRLRLALLTLSLFLMAIPGLKGFEMNPFGIRLGLFQPFKFVFIAWLALQAWSTRSEFKALAYRIPLWFWAGLVLWNGGLICGLAVEGGGERGWSIYFSLVLGQIAAWVTLADPQWSTQTVRKGLFAAVLLLAGFAVLESLFTDTAVTLWVLKYVRDTGYVGAGGGSLLSTSALAEYAVRVLPLFIFFSLQSRADFIATFLLIFLGLLTLGRGALISLFLVFLIFLTYLRRTGRLGARQLGIVFLGLVSLAVLAVVFKGPDMIKARYWGGFMQSRIGVIPEDKPDFIRDSQLSVIERQNYFGMGLQAARAYLLTGVGIDGFAYRNFNRLHPFEDNPKPLGVHTHNLMLEFLVSGGIFCLVGFLILWVGGLAFSLRSPLHWPLLTYIVGGSVSLMIDARIYVSWLAISFAWIPAMVWKESSRSE